MGQSELLQDGRHLISLAVLLIAPLLDTLIRALVLHFMPPMRGEGRIAQKAYASNVVPIPAWRASSCSARCC